jgi:hypothetical protein
MPVTLADVRDPSDHFDPVDEPRARPTPGDRPPTSPATTGTSPAASAFDWCFRSRETGHITIAQFPNIPLGLFLASVVVGWVVPETTTAHQVVDWVGVAALGWWAADELIRGVNPWRRALGVVGLALTISGVVRLLSPG